MDVQPTPPLAGERYRYLARHLPLLTLASVAGFIGMMLSMVRFAEQSRWTVPFLVPIVFIAASFGAALLSSCFSRGFDRTTHERLVANWKPTRYPTVDIFLPTCGEDLALLANTAKHVAGLRYPGEVVVYSLDDSARREVAELAGQHGFVYLSRPNRGWFKKAGNLRYGFERSAGEFVVVFDADFSPDPDFLIHLLPYFEDHDDLGIVQSPQYFRVQSRMNWIERGAGAVQEFFYRVSLTGRQSRNAAICVGTNAIYRRAALESNGGSTLIEHSEDVHTGFDLFRNGWRLKYVPVVLAVGICPSTLAAFFSQQYRWCLGSVSLLTSSKFWRTKLPFRSRLCYLSGFGYYMQTAMMSVVGPLVPLTMIYAVPQNVRLVNYVLLIPGTIYAFVVFPLWHRCRYSFETWAIRMAYGWAHLFAILDKLRGRQMSWAPTMGRRTNANKTRFRDFKLSLAIWGGGTATLWVGGALWQLATSGKPLTWVPIAAGGLFYAATVARVLFGAREQLGLERNLVRRVDDPPRAHALAAGGTRAAVPAAITQQALVD